MNPMTWTKKQKITGVVILSVLILGGITAGVVNHQNQVHAQQVAQEKAAKLSHERKVKALEKKKAQEAEEKVKTLLEKANQNPSEATIKAVNMAIAQLTSEIKQEKYLADLKPMTARLALLNKARAAVKDYQAHATDPTKQKLAQDAINALKDKNDADVKTELQKQYDASRKQVEDAAKTAKAKSTQVDKSENASVEAQSQNTNNSAQSNDSTSAGNGTSYNPSTPNYAGSSNTGSNNANQNNNTGNNNSNGGGNAGNSNNNNNNSGNTGNGGGTTPTVRYAGVVYVDGVVKYRQVFNTNTEAVNWASAIYHGAEMEDLMFAGHSVSWATEIVS